MRTVKLKRKDYIIDNINKFVGGYEDTGSYLLVNFICKDSDPLKIQSTFLWKYDWIISSDIISVS